MHQSNRHRGCGLADRANIILLNGVTLMATLLTLAEINERYESEWVLVGDPQLDSQLTLVRGQVLFHSKSRDEVDRKDLELLPESAAIIYTGQLPHDAAVVL